VHRLALCSIRYIRIYACKFYFIVLSGFLYYELKDKDSDVGVKQETCKMNIMKGMVETKEVGKVIKWAIFFF